MYEIIISNRDSLGYELDGYYLAIVKGNIYYINIASICGVCNITRSKYIEALAKYKVKYSPGLDRFLFKNEKLANDFKQEIIEPLLVMKVLNNRR